MHPALHHLAVSGCCSSSAMKGLLTRQRVAGIRFQLENQIDGSFAFIAYAHPRIFDFRYVSETRAELYNTGNDQPMVAIHMWPGDNLVATEVIWPMVREFEASLGISPDWPL